MTAPAVILILTAFLWFCIGAVWMMDRLMGPDTDLQDEPKCPTCGARWPKHRHPAR